MRCDICDEHVDWSRARIVSISNANITYELYIKLLLCGTWLTDSELVWTCEECYCYVCDNVEYSNIR